MGDVCSLKLGTILCQYLLEAVLLEMKVYIVC